MEIKPIQNISLKQKIRHSLKNIVHQMEKNDENRLPGEHELAKSLGITRISLRDVLKELEQEGVIYRIQGKGTYINKNALKMKVTLNPAVEFRQAIEKSGYKPTVDLVEVIIEPAIEKVRFDLNLKQNCKVVCAKKIFYADGEPVIYCEDIFARDLVTGDIIDRELEQSTFEYLLEKSGLIVTHDITELVATNSLNIPDHEQLYNIHNSKPLLLLKSVYYNIRNKPVMVVRAYYDTEYIKLNLIRRQDVYRID